jgi:hypothetical protein
MSQVQILPLPCTPFGFIYAWSFDLTNIGSIPSADDSAAMVWLSSGTKGGRKIRDDEEPNAPGTSFDST